MTDERDGLEFGAVLERPQLNPRPLWRWWLWCIVFDLWWRTQWGWLSDLHAWLILPEWLGYGADCSDGTGEVPW